MEAIDNILKHLIEWSENRVPINPEMWIDAGLKLNVLKEDGLNGQIIALQSSLAQKRYQILQEGKTAAFAKIAVEADPQYAECRKLEAKVKMIEEHIRLAKIRGKMGLDDYNSH